MRLLGTNTKERVAEIIGHELRNPLASAIANLTVPIEMTDDADPRSAFMNQVMVDLSRMSTLLTAYLDFGNPRDTLREDLDLIEVVATVVERFGDQEAEVEVDFESSHGPALVHGDPVLLERFVENLLENAVSMGASHVDVYVTREGDECILHVSDNGPGVEAELRDELFVPFVSGRGSSGIGLALVRDIVESHGGSIALLPSMFGAVFRVSLPVACMR